MGSVQVTDHKVKEEMKDDYSLDRGATRKKEYGLVKYYQYYFWYRNSHFLFSNGKRYGTSVRSH